MTTWVRPPLVTEHENAHYWPDGEYDGPADEDCAFCAGLMLYLAAHPNGAHASLAQAELIRHAAGLHPTGGASAADVASGLKTLLGWAPVLVQGFDALWAALKAGVAAGISGIPTNAPASSPLRRWLPNYDLGHMVFGGRYDTTLTLLVGDPEAPAGSSLVRVTKSDIAAFAKDPGRVHLVAPMAATKVVRRVVSAGGFLWTLPRATAGSIKKQELVVGQVATVTGKVTGGAWSFDGKSGNTWYRVTEINGVRLAVALYGATGRFA